jgi:endonuclease/exonuclease/phosphatase family metal-dependent hydrolase
VRKLLVTHSAIRTLIHSVLALVLFAGAASAQTTVKIATTEAQVTDATIGSGTAANVVDNGATLTTRVSTDINATRRALLKFDTENYVPAAATIQSAKLTVFLSAGAGDASRRVAAYEVKQSFQETQATWVIRKTGYRWTTAGGDLGTKFAEAVVPTTAGTAVTFDVTRLVQARVNAGSSRYTRIALVDIDPADSTSYRKYHSSEASTTALRPVLTVVYGAATTTTTTSTTTTSSTGTTLKVLHWNLHHGAGTDGKYDITRIANWIVKMNPDVISLNEVEKNTWWGNEDQPARYKAMLEAKTGRTWYTVFCQEYGNWTANGKGNMILSRFPWTSIARYELSYDRTVALGQLVVNGRNVTFMSTHLDPDSATRRMTQSKQLLAWAVNFQENRIVAGDMNAQPGSPEMLEIKKTYVDAWADAKSRGIAFSAPDNPNGYTRRSRIDFVFTSKTASNLVTKRVEVVDTRDANGVMPSDHRPMIVTYEVR